METYKFRLLLPSDFPLMLEWLSRKHVKKWWNDGDDTLEKVTCHYGKNDDTKRFILVEINGANEKPIGYFQYYFAAEAVIGIDQFISEEDRLNKGLGEKTIKLFIEIIMREQAPKTIILDPSPENKRAIRCYEKIGFRHYQNNKNDAAYMMGLETNDLNK